MPRQAFGQHFLTNQGVIEKIIQALNLQKETSVLEIGPGRGALTFPLSKIAKPFLLIDKDKRMVEFLQESLPAKDSIQILQEDFLRVSWEKIVSILGNNFSVVSNLPYETSVAIFLRLLENLPSDSDMILMFQKEVAERLKAKPSTKDYGSLSVYTQVFTKIEKVCDVSPKSFRPAPKVESSVLKITTLLNPLISNLEKSSFEALIRTGFAQRRKMLRQKLKSYAGDSAKKIEQWLENLGVSPQARAEELTPLQWINFYRKIKNEGLNSSR